MKFFDPDPDNMDVFTVLVVLGAGVTLCVVLAFFLELFRIASDSHKEPTCDYYRDYQIEEVPARCYAYFTPGSDGSLQASGVRSVR